MKLITFSLCIVALVISALPASADALDVAILKRMQKESADAFNAGVSHHSQKAVTSRSNSFQDQNKLSGQEQAEVAIAGLAESVASSHLTQHSITHSSSTVAQIPHR